MRARPIKVGIAAVYGALAVTRQGNTMGAGASNAIQGLSVEQFVQLRRVYDDARGEGDLSAEAEQQLLAKLQDKYAELLQTSGAVAGPPTTSMPSPVSGSAGSSELENFMVGDVVMARPDGERMLFEGHVSELFDDGTLEVEFGSDEIERIPRANCFRKFVWDHLEVGDHVKVRYKGGHQRFEAVITRAVDHEHYDVLYEEDGETESNVHRSMIEKLLSHRSSAAAKWSRVRHAVHAMNAFKSIQAMGFDPGRHRHDHPHDGLQEAVPAASSS